MSQAILTERQSKTLTIIKGLAILMVIMIHCDFRERLPYDYSLALDLYGQCLTREVVFNAVPLFFFVSGFLFFLNEESIWIKWKKRIKTLLIPYLVWCSLYFLYLFLMQRVFGLESYFTGTKLKYIKDFMPIDYLRMYWDIRDGGPILAPLWFLRNLIVLSVLAPIFKFLSERLGFIFWVILLVNFLFFHFTMIPLTDSDLFFFGSGVYLLSVKNKFNIFNFTENLKLWHILSINTVLLISTLICYKMGLAYYQLSHNLFMISNSIFILKIVSILVSKYEMKMMFAISAASFFIYLAHEPWISYFQSFFYKGIHVPEYIIVVMPWFFVALAVCYTYCGYILLKRFCPKLLSFLTGSR